MDNSANAIKFVMESVLIGVKFGYIDFDSSIINSNKLGIAYSVPENYKNGETIISAKEISNNVETRFAELMTEKINPETPFSKNDFKFTAIVRSGETFTDKDSQELINSVKSKIESE